MPFGIFINLTVMLLISLTEGHIISYRTILSDDPVTAFLVNYLVSLLVGFAFAFGSAIYEVERWSMTKQTFLHFVLVTGTFIPGAVLAGWSKPELASILMYIGIFILIYILIWVVQYSFWKKRIQSINQKLKHQ